MRTIHYFLSLTISGAFLFTGCKQDANTAESTSGVEQETVQPESNKGQAYIDDDSETPNALRVALNSEDHTTLVAAVEAAEVQNALVNVGPLTVFAPTNEAFDKLPEGTVEDLLKAENKDKLAYILTHHVAPSNHPVDMLNKSIDKGRTLYMASGENVEIAREGEDIFVGGAKILGTVKASNGWVHVIDAVILPNNK
jgi:uncharacterized surface protein with fasciclin (FAS1) repeats